MNRFLKEFATFSFLLALTLNATGYALIKSSSQGHAVEASGFYRCLDKARGNLRHSQIFVFGDSVTNQMYPPELNSERINSLTLLMPSTMAGQYLLLRRLAESTDLQGKEVILVLSPQAFASDLSHQSSYHYVLKPFHNNEFQPWEDSVYSDRIASNFLTDLSQLPAIKCSNWNPPVWMRYLDEASPQETEDREGISDFSYHYLNLFIHFTRASGARLRILPTVQRQSKSASSYSDLKSDIRTLQLDSVFEEYFSSFVYIDDQYFVDSAHLRDRQILGENILKL